MVYVSKLHANNYRQSIYELLTLGTVEPGWTNHSRDYRQGAIMVNLYEGAMPADISDSVEEVNWTVYHSSDDRYTGLVQSTIPNTKLASVLLNQFTDNFGFKTLSPDNGIGEELRMLSNPLTVSPHAEGTIGFYEIIFLGYRRIVYDSSLNTGYSNITEANMNPNDPDYNSSSARGVNNWFYRYHPKSAMYGTVGTLNSNNEMILDKLEVTMAEPPQIYEFGLNPVNV